MMSTGRDAFHRPAARPGQVPGSLFHSSAVAFAPNVVFSEDEVEFEEGFDEPAAPLAGSVSPFGALDTTTGPHLGGVFDAIGKTYPGEQAIGFQQLVKYAFWLDVLACWIEVPVEFQDSNVGNREFATLVVRAPSDLCRLLPLFVPHVHDQALRRELVELCVALKVEVAAEEKPCALWAQGLAAASFRVNLSSSYTTPRKASGPALSAAELADANAEARPYTDYMQAEITTQSWEVALLCAEQLQKGAAKKKNGGKPDRWRGSRVAIQKVLDLVSVDTRCPPLAEPRFALVQKAFRLMDEGFSRSKSPNFQSWKLFKTNEWKHVGAFGYAPLSTEALEQYIRHWSTLPEEFFAWLAGVIDGDGYINPYAAIQVSCQRSADRLRAESIQRVLGVGSILDRPDQDLSVLTIPGRLGRHLLPFLAPYLQGDVKHAQLRKLNKSVGFFYEESSRVALLPSWLIGLLTSDGTTILALSLVEIGGVRLLFPQLYVRIGNAQYLLLEYCRLLFGGTLNSPNQPHQEALVAKGRQKAFAWSITDREAVRAVSALLQETHQRIGVTTAKDKRLALIERFYALVDAGAYYPEHPDFLHFVSFLEEDWEHDWLPEGKAVRRWRRMLWEQFKRDVVFPPIPE